MSLTEMTRMRAWERHVVSDPARGRPPVWPSAAQVGEAIYVCDVGVYPGNSPTTWAFAGFLVLGPEGMTSYELFSPDPAYRKVIATWAYDAEGLLGMAALVANGVDNIFFNHVVVDPATAAVVESGLLIPTPFRFTNTRPWYPGLVDVVGDGVSLLLTHSHASAGGTGPVVVVDCVSSRSGFMQPWSFTETERPGDSAITPTSTVDGVGFKLGGYYGSTGHLLHGGGDIVVPNPDGYGSSEGWTAEATFWRQFGGDQTLVLSVGYNMADTPPGAPMPSADVAYDVCIYMSAVKSSWQGHLRDDGYHPDWGSGTLQHGIAPAIRDGIVVLTNPGDPTADWAWATLPPGAGLNEWMWFLIDGDRVQIHYGGRVVLVWRMPPSVYQGFVDGGASMGFYNPYTRTWQAETPPGWTDPEMPPLGGWAYTVDSRHWVGEDGEEITAHGRRIEADDVLVFPGDRAVVGQFLQDDVITAAPIKYLAGRVLPPVVLDRDDAELVWDAGYGHYLYPVEAT